MRQLGKMLVPTFDGSEVCELCKKYYRCNPKAKDKSSVLAAFEQAGVKDSIIMLFKMPTKPPEATKIHYEPWELAMIYILRDYGNVDWGRFAFLVF